MLKFTGVGSAFNTELGNTSAFIKRNSSLLLIDCGGAVFDRLQKLRLLDDVKNLYIIITHTHPDHIGSLGEVIFYTHYVLKQKARIFFPARDLMEKLCTCIGVTEEMYVYDHAEKVRIKDDFLQAEIEFLAVSHVDTIPAYGFIMNFAGNKFYYSGDANNISKKVIDMLKNGQIDRLYQDTSELDYEGNAHLSLRLLGEMIEPAYREKVFCMHIDKTFIKSKASKLGFNVAEVEKEFQRE